MSKAIEMFPTQATLEDGDVKEKGQPPLSRVAVCEGAASIF